MLSYRYPSGLTTGLAHPKPSLDCISSSAISKVQSRSVSRLENHMQSLPLIGEGSKIGAGRKFRVGLQWARVARRPNDRSQRNFWL